ncbi:MAG: cob(I)yrinic acid a,c-diamide adenosyltransferase [Pseudomonadota bacterium]
MVALGKITTKTGDGGETGLVTGERVAKTDPRIEAIGAVDELNAAIGVARAAIGLQDALDPVLSAIQNDLFDLGADLATPTDAKLDFEPLRLVPAQTERLEREADALNAELEPLASFILPAGAPPVAALHLARTIARRAERRVWAALAIGGVSEPCATYLNRVSDFLFIAARVAAKDRGGDALWVPAAGRG